MVQNLNHAKAENPCWVWQAGPRSRLRKWRDSCVWVQGCYYKQSGPRILFEQRTKIEEAGPRGVKRWSVPDRVNSTCKGPGVGLGMWAEQHGGILQPVRGRVTAVSPQEANHMLIGLRTLEIKYVDNRCRYVIFSYVGEITTMFFPHKGPIC